MKKLLYTLVCLVIVFNLTACNNTAAPSEKITKPQEEIKVESLQAAVKPIEEDDTKISNIDKNPENTQTTVVVQKPEAERTKKVIVLDPGHANKSNLQKELLAPGSKEFKIKDGGGAAGIVTRTPEYQINMSVALKLKGILEKKGYSVIMTKTENSQSLGNIERAELWNKTKAELVVRIHADSNENSTVKGASMLVPSNINENTKAIYKQSKEYGQIVLNKLTGQIGMSSRGVIERKDMTGFNWSRIPVILVEMGFLSNKEEDKLLSSQEYQDKIANALAEGIFAAVK
jgi:N-acetylmuramoyl-L-alanine amidase